MLLRGKHRSLPRGAFTKAIASYTHDDGFDAAPVITDIFAALDLSDKSYLPEYLRVFPYVNGHLFGRIPHTRSQRSIESPGISWST
ncbi:type IIL restriction-modification enzyme MmeI [Corynebacterium pseudokroppenstedtii]|uniref:Type IIL restriction-modification enzyme MmeI n=1 Tax=Corynebacterium pseudokroppenstedtii TaxID=2804917 RepID=A0AAU0PYG8_9CORY|nr:type IIL restriction-modification enzyme MmeI [Corynebacterium pseudokroppenstedtii]